jgi:hypothetical protein
MEEEKPKKKRRVPGEKREDGKSPILPGKRNEVARERIQTSLIVKELEECVLNPRKKMSMARINAAKILLSKTMPDLASSKVEVESSPVQFFFNMNKKPADAKKDA